MIVMKELSKESTYISVQHSKRWFYTYNYDELNKIYPGKRLRCNCMYGILIRPFVMYKLSLTLFSAFNMALTNLSIKSQTRSQIIGPMMKQHRTSIKRCIERTGILET